MHYLGARLIDDAIAQRAHAEAEIGVLIIGRPVGFREAAEPFEQFAANEQRRSRDVIRVAQEVVSRILGILGMADVPPGRIAPENVSGFLQPAVRIEQFGADRTDLGIAFGGDDEMFEPAAAHDRVVVQEAHVSSARDRGASIAGANESFVLPAAHVVDARQRRHDVGRSVERTVVDDDELHVQRFEPAIGQRAQAARRDVAMVVYGDDYSHHRRIGHRAFGGPLIPRFDEQRFGLAQHRAARTRRNRTRAELRRPRGVHVVGRNDSEHGLHREPQHSQRVEAARHNALVIRAKRIEAILLFT